MKDPETGKEASGKKSLQIIGQFFPILVWGARYNKRLLVNDLIVAVIVTLMLIPQSLAYATLAGLPPEVGLYASMLPLMLYAIFGTSQALAVGPVAVISLMTASAIAPLAAVGTPEYYTAAILLAFISGLMLLLMGILKLGFVANFLSHPVISGFITASGLLIASGQLFPLMGIQAQGDTFFQNIWNLAESIRDANVYTAAIGILSFMFLFWVRKSLAPVLRSLGVKERAASIIARVGPVMAIILSIAAVIIFSLDEKGVRLVGVVPQGFPTLSMPTFDFELWRLLMLPALFIAIVGYAESISVAQTLAAKKRQRIDPNQELIALGAANLGAGFTAGFPVTGGFARSVVNFDAGAETPAAGAFTAVGIAIATLFLTPLLFYLPNATLAATIMVAVLSLVDFKTVRHTFEYSKADGAAMLATILITLSVGVEAGLVAGVSLSVLLHLFKASRPHIAVVGQVPGTEHFRNVKRHQVITDTQTVSIRVDESLFFPNARYIEDKVNEVVAENPNMKHLILMCSAINSIDASALESLEAINRRLKDSGVTLHLSEVKGPVMDRLLKTHFTQNLTGKIHLTQYDAWSSINPELAIDTLKMNRKEQQ